MSCRSASVRRVDVREETMFVRGRDATIISSSRYHLHIGEAVVVLARVLVLWDSLADCCTMSARRDSSWVVRPQANIVEYAAPGA